MYEYAFVHVVYTIPLALLLSLLLAPLLTRLDVYKIVFLITVAFTYTLPWDSYLVKNKIWTYPPDAILGPSLLSVPAEELFFFVVQTYITTCLQILVNKPVLSAIYLRNESVQEGPLKAQFHGLKQLGQLFFAACFVVPVAMSSTNREGTYIRLIVGWVAPIFFMLWTFAYQFLIGLPKSKTLLPIVVPTFFLWVVDTLALRRGTWSIESGTKLGIHVWPHLEIEEALFFLVTNSMIVIGSCAFDNAIAILDAFPNLFPKVPGVPSPIMMLQALFVPTSSYDNARLEGLQNALSVLAKKSRSFYLASGVFNGRLRIDLILLYGFCRIADDLIDDAPSADEAEKWIGCFTEFLDASYAEKHDELRIEKSLSHFPPKEQSIMKLLPIEKLPPQPLYSLLDGFRMDLKFTNEKSQDQAPIQTEEDLHTYATCVAATIGELCLSLVYFHDPDRKVDDAATKQRCIDAGVKMGRVLQYINIVRDVTNDAEVGRCYIPDQWFSKSLSQMSPEEKAGEILKHRKRILDTAFEGYFANRDAIEELPNYARGGIRVAVESYMEIGRVLRRRIAQGQPLDLAGSGKAGRASVPKLQRIWVGWRTMAGWRGTT